MRAGEYVERRERAVAEERVGGAAEDEVVEGVDRCVDFDGVGDVQRRLHAQSHVGAADPVVTTAPAPGLDTVDAARDQVAKAVGIGAALVGRGWLAVDGLVGDGGRREKFVVGGVVFGVRGSDGLAVGFAVA